MPLLNTPQRVGRSLLVRMESSRTGTTLASNPKTTGALILLGSTESITLSPLCMLPASMLTLHLHLNLSATMETPLDEWEATRPKPSIEPSMPLNGWAMPPLTLEVSVFRQAATITTAPALTLGQRLIGNPDRENRLNTVIVRK